MYNDQVKALSELFEVNDAEWFIKNTNTLYEVKRIVSEGGHDYADTVAVAENFFVAKLIVNALAKYDRDKLQDNADYINYTVKSINGNKATIPHKRTRQEPFTPAEQAIARLHRAVEADKDAISELEEKLTEALKRNDDKQIEAIENKLHKLQDRRQT